MGFMRDSVYFVVIKVLIASIILGNIVILSYAFLYPRLVFMVKHWGASEREILLSEGPRDNPNMEHLRKFYKMMYFLKDHSEEGGVIYFVDHQFFSNEVYKILLPRKIKYLDPRAKKASSPPRQREAGMPSYIVFRKKDKPDFCRMDRIVWDESGCGIYKLEYLWKDRS